MEEKREWWWIWLTTALSCSIVILMVVTPVRQWMVSLIQCILARYELNRLVINKEKEEDEVHQITVSSIHIYPVKSLRGISVKSARIDNLGLEGDRRLMLVRPNYETASSSLSRENSPTHRFITQRQCPAFATINTNIISSPSLSKTSASKSTSQQHQLIIQLWTDANPNSKLSIDISNQTLLNNRTYPTRYKAAVWNDIVDVVDLGDAPAKFVSQTIHQYYNTQNNNNNDIDIDSNNDNDNKDYDSFKQLFQDIRLVSILPNITNRPTDSRYIPHAAKSLPGANPPQTALNDGFPLLLASQESLQDLNQRILANPHKPDKHSTHPHTRKPLPMTRFRPNIVIQGLKYPFQEDTFKIIQFQSKCKLKSKPILHIVKGCPRCKQSCTDQITGDRDIEPLQTLRTFRALGHNPDDVYFAQNAVFQPVMQHTHTHTLTHTQPSSSSSTHPQTISVGDKIHILKTGKPIWDIDVVQAE